LFIAEPNSHELRLDFFEPARATTMKRLAWLLPIGVTTLLGVSDALGQGRSLQVINQCAAQVWAVVTPGGNPRQGAALYNSAGWFQPSASQFNWVPTGFTGNGPAGSTMTVSSCQTCCPASVSQCPNSSNFVAGQSIKVGNFVTTITQVSISASSATLTLSPALPQAVTNASISIPSQMASAIAASGTLSLAIPNGGAPSVNFSFAMGNCPGGPFGGSCIIGSNALAQLNTLFEATFGCAVSNPQACAFNPGNPASLCQNEPTLANCGPLGSGDTYDVSAVNGYTIPMKVTVAPPAGATAGQCAPIDASVLDLASCPSEKNTTIFSTDPQQQTAINGGVSLLAQDSSGNYQACASPFEWLANAYGTQANPHPTPNPNPLPACCGSAGTNPSCPQVTSGAFCTSTSYYAGAGCYPNKANQALGCPAGGGSPSGVQEQVGPGSPTSVTPTGQYAIHNTNYVQQLYQMGYRGYTWQYGDAVGTQTCPSIGTSGTSYPAYTVTLCPNGGLPYSKAQTWTYSSSSGLCVLSQSGSYASLAACQQANLKYACVAQPDDSGVPNAMWTVAATGRYLHAAIPTPTLVCQNISLTVSGQSSPVPHCTYVYGGGTSAKPCGPYLSGAHDFNGDSTSDILWYNTGNGQVLNWLINGTSVIGGGSPGSAQSPWTIVGQRDFNGDGHGDILWRNGSTGQALIWFLNGSTVIGGGSPGGPPTNWTVAGTGDFNRDGYGDILWFDASSGQAQVWLLNGFTVIGGGSPGTVPNSWTIAGTGDFNGDGYSDILWYNTGTGQVLVWLLNGAVVIGGGSPGTAMSPWTIAGTGDFNNDGMSDILWHNTSTGQTLIWFLNGATTISGGSPGSATNPWSIVQTGDFNGDGYSDILWYNTGNGQVLVWLLNGGTVIGGGSPGLAPSPWQVQGMNVD
jgi:hypothetical protein